VKLDRKIVTLACQVAIDLVKERAAAARDEALGVLGRVTADEDGRAARQPAQLTQALGVGERLRVEQALAGDRELARRKAIWSYFIGCGRIDYALYFNSGLSQPR